MRSTRSLREKRERRRRLEELRRRRLISVGYEALEKRLLLAVTPSISSSEVTFSGDGSADDLYLQVGVNQNLQYRTDDQSPWIDLTGVQPGITETQITVDLKDGADALYLDESFVTAMESQQSSGLTYKGGNASDKVAVIATGDDGFELSNVGLKVGDASAWVLESVELSELIGGDQDTDYVVGAWNGSLQLVGGSGQDTYSFTDAWGTAEITDSDGALDFSGLSGAITLRVDGDPTQIEALNSTGSVVGTVNIPTGVSSGLNAFEVASDKSTFDSGMAKLRDVLGDISQEGLLGQTNRFLGDSTADFDKSLADFLRLDESINDYLVAKFAALDNDVTVDALVDVLSVSGELQGGASGTVDVSASLPQDGGIELDVSFQVDRSSTAKLNVFTDALGEVIKLPEGQYVDTSFSTAVQWGFLVGIDSAGHFYGDFDQSDVTISASSTEDLNLDGAAGLLGVNGAGTLSLNLDLAVDTNALNVDGSGRTSFSDLVNVDAQDVPQLDTQVSDELEIGLTVIPLPGIGGDAIAPGNLIYTVNELLVSSTPQLSKNSFDDIEPFYNLDSNAVRQMLRTFGDLADLLSAKTLDSQVIGLTADTSFGDVFDLETVFAQDFLDLIELPPFDSSTLLTEITDGESAGTSGNSASEIRVTLSNDETFEIDLDENGPITLGELVQLIVDAVGDTNLLNSVTDSNGKISLVDQSNGGGEFSITALSGGGETYKIAEQLGLDSKATKRDLGTDGVNESIIVVAPNPGPRFTTLQQLSQFASAGVNTSISDVSYDFDGNPAGPTAQFTVGIVRSYADVEALEAELANLGPLTNLVTDTRVDLLNPTLALALPFELLLTPVGGSLPNDGTLIADLNSGKGVPAIGDDGDLLIQVGDGRSFTVNLDLGIGEVSLSSLGVSTSDSLSITMNDGTNVAIDLSSLVPSLNAPPQNLTDLAELINLAADAVTSNPGELQAKVDSARGTFSLIDRTTGSGGNAFSVSGSAAANLGLNGNAALKVISGLETYVIEDRSLLGYTLGDLLQRIRESAARTDLTGTVSQTVVVDPDTDSDFLDNASLTDATAMFTPGLLVGSSVELLGAGGVVTASRKIVANDSDTLGLNTPWSDDVSAGTSYRIKGSGLTLPNPGNLNADWDFDVQYLEEGLVLVDRTVRAAEIVGSVTSPVLIDDSADNDPTDNATLTDASQAFTPDELIGRVVEITSGNGSGQSLRIISNTANVLILEADWESDLQAGDSYRITTDLYVQALNGSGSRQALGLSGFERQQDVSNETPLFSGNDGVVIGSNGAGTSDLRISLGDGVTVFEVDLDAGTAQTVGDLVAAIEVAGQPFPNFEVNEGPGGNFSLVDRSSVVTRPFTIEDINGSSVAANLVLDVTAGPGDVDFDGVDETIIPLGSSTRILGGLPLHGDTPLAHIRLIDLGNPHLAIDIGIDDVPSGSRSGTGLFGPLGIEFAGFDIGPNASVEANLTLKTRTLRQLNEGLADPNALLIGGQVDLNLGVELGLDLQAAPAIQGVSGTTLAQVQFSNYYDFSRGNEAISLQLPDAGNAVRDLLLSVERLTIDDVIGTVAEVGDYVLALQEQTALSDRLPGMQQSVGDILGFGDLFQIRVEELRNPGDREFPKTLQEVNSLLATPFEDSTTIISELAFDPVSRNLEFDLDFAPADVNTSLPVTLDLTKIFTPSELAALGLQKVAAIVDVGGESPIDVAVSGLIDLNFGIQLAPFLAGSAEPGAASDELLDTNAFVGFQEDELTGVFVNLFGLNGSFLESRQVIANTSDTLTLASDWTVPIIGGESYEIYDAPTDILFGEANSSNGTQATFSINAVDNDDLNFTAAFGSLPVTITGGGFTLDGDGDSGTNNSAIYSVELQSDFPLITESSPQTAAAQANSPISIAGELNANFDLAFPDSILPIDLPIDSVTGKTVVPFLDVEVVNLLDPQDGSSLITTNLTETTNAGVVTAAANTISANEQWPTFERLASNFSLEDSMEGFKLGFYDLFDKLDEVLDQAIFDSELPLIGNSLIDAADFLDQIRDAVFDNLSDYESVLTPDLVKQGIYDAVGPGGLGWLQDDTGPANPDSIVNFEDISLVRETSSSENSRDLLVGAEYRMHLEMPEQLLEYPVDFDFLLPGLGLESEGQVDLYFGFKMPLNVGISISDGVYIDVNAANELEASLRVEFPDNNVRLRGNPNLTFANTTTTPPTISRDQGNWYLDDFRVGNMINVSGSGDNDGEYVITAIDAEGRELTLSEQDLDGSAIVSAGPQGEIQIELSGVAMIAGDQLSFDPSANQISRTSGSWQNDGFRLGDIVTITGTNPTTDGSYTVVALNSVGTVLTVEESLASSGTGVQQFNSASIFNRTPRGFAGKMGILPYRIWDVGPSRTKVEGNFVIDWLDPSVIAGNERLSQNDLIAADPFNDLTTLLILNAPEYQGVATGGDLDQLVDTGANFVDSLVGRRINLLANDGRVVESRLIVGGDVNTLQLDKDWSQSPVGMNYEIALGGLTVHDMQLKLESTLGRDAAIPNYRMDLNLSDWDWTISDSAIQELSSPVIEADYVQFELVSFVRDFLGPVLTRIRVGMEPLDGVLDFVRSEFFVIANIILGRGSYVNAAGPAGAEIGNYAGSSLAIRALVDGGRPFDVPGTEFAKDAFYATANFLVDFLTLRGARFASDDLDFTTPIGAYQYFEKDDSASSLELDPIMSLTGREWIHLGKFAVNGEAARGSTAVGLFDSASYPERTFGKEEDKPLRLVGEPDLLEFVNDGSGGKIKLSAATSDTWARDGFVENQEIVVLGGPNAGTYSVTAVSGNELSVAENFPQPTSIRYAHNIEIAVQNSDGSVGGSILGQINALVGEDRSSAASAAQSYLVTRLLPGKGSIDGFISALGSQIIAAAAGGISPIKTPILDEHSFDLLTGDILFGKADASQTSLLSYDSPELFVQLYQDIPLGACFPFNRFIKPLAPILCKAWKAANLWEPFIAFSWEARADFEVGFDSTGLQRYSITGNPGDLIDGFYFDDYEGIEPTPGVIGNLNVGAGDQSSASSGLGAAATRSDEPQIRVLGGVGFGVSAGKDIAGLLIAKVGLEATGFIGWDYNFADPNGDGRIRATEFDVMAGFAADYVTETYIGTGEDVYDQGLRIEVRFDIFARLKAFITLVDLRINILTIGFTIPAINPDISGAPDLGASSNGTLILNFVSGQDNTLYVGASSAPDDLGRQDIIVSGRNYYETFLAVERIEGVAGAGDDAVFVGESVLLPLLLNGGGGDDTLVAGSGPATLIGGLGNDRLVGGKSDDHLWGDEGPGESVLVNGGDDTIFGGDGMDVIRGSVGRDVIRGWRDDDDISGGDDRDFIDGGTGDDTIDGGDGDDNLSGGIGQDVIYGGLGQDLITGGRDRDLIYGENPESSLNANTSQPITADAQENADQIFGGLGNDEIYGGPGGDHIQGEGHNDQLDGQDGIDLVEGGGGTNQTTGGMGDDLLTSRNGNDILNGQEGDDTYQVFFEGGKTQSLIQIVDRGSAEDTDVLVVFGTLLDDQFLLRADASGANAFVALLNDPDNEITDPAYDPTVERANYFGVERIVVNGGFGDDRFAVDDTAAEVTLNGESGDDTFQIGQLFRSQRTNADANVAIGDVLATIETTRGFLSNGISQPMTANGGLGSDRFVVFHNKAVLSLNGDEGDDNFEVRAFALAGSQEPQRERTDITGGGGADLVQYAVNSPVNINGGDGFDTLIVIGTEFGDDFVVTNKGVFGAGLTINFVNIESLRVDGAEGDDRFFVQSTGEDFLTELFGGLGEDTFNMSGDTPPVVSNDLLGHSGIVTNDVVHSTDVRYQDLILHGVSANVADNDEPFVVVRQTDGSSIVGESSDGDLYFVDSYQVVLTRQPQPGFDVLVKALAPIPTPDQRELGALAFRMRSSSTGSDEKADGSVVTLRFTSQNWYIPQQVEILADDTEQVDTGQLFTREELIGEDAVFQYDDIAYEGRRSTVVNHLVVSEAATVEGAPVSVEASTSVTILTDRPFYEFPDREITVTLDNGTVQKRRIVKADFIDGTMRLLVDRSWSSANELPDESSTYSIDLDGFTLTGSPLTATNPSITVSDPLNPNNPYLDSIEDLIGRQVTIVGGQGTGQTRFISGVEAVVHLDGSTGGLFTPVPPDAATTFQFGFDLTNDDAPVSVTSGAVLRVTANGDFNNLGEQLSVDVDGILAANLFGDSAGRFYREMVVELPIEQSQLQQMLADGFLEVTFTPSQSEDPIVNVDDFDEPGSEVISSLFFELNFTANAATTDFAPGVTGDLRLGLDRSWEISDVPNTSSLYQIRIDDALAGRVSAYDESPENLPFDSSFPASLDQRTTISDSFRDFSSSNLGSEGLRGAVIQIVGGPGAGQERLILGADTSDSSGHTLLLNGPWNTDLVPGESIYRIARYDSLSIPSVSVEIDDNDAAGLIVQETQGFQANAAFSDTQTQTNVANGNTLDFEFRVDQLPPTGEGTLTVTAVADLDANTEYLTLDIEGLATQDLFVIDGLQLEEVSTVITLPPEQLAQLSTDGVIQASLTPSAAVDDFGGQVTLTLDFSSSLPTDSDTVTAVIEGGDGDYTGERDVLRVRLSRVPTAETIVTLHYNDSQLQLRQLDGTSFPQNQILFDATNWNLFRDVVVIAPQDQVREGFHTELIEFSVQSGDVDEPQVQVDRFDIADQAATEFVGLSRLPVIIDSQVEQRTNQGQLSIADVAGLLSDEDGFYNGFALKIGEESRQIVDYIGSSRTLVVDPVFSTQIAQGDAVQIGIGVLYDDQFLSEGTQGGTSAAPVFEVKSNKLIFRADGELTTVVGNDLEISYQYTKPGFNDVFRKPVLVRISDADAPTVLVRETGGSTDVVEVRQVESPQAPNEIPAGFDTTGSPWEDVYELVLTAAPVDNGGDNGGVGTGFVEVTVTPEITKTTRTGGIRTDRVQVELFDFDQIGSPRLVHEDNGHLTIRFDQSNWDTPVRIGVRAIDDAKVDGSDTKVFAQGPNVVSGILGPVVVDGAGGDGSLVGIAPPVLLPNETNLRQKLGEILAISGREVTIALSSVQLEALGLQSDLSDLDELIGRTFEVVAANPTVGWLSVFPSADIGSLNDPVVGQFRLIEDITETAGEITLHLNERFGVAGEEVGTVLPQNLFGATVGNIIIDDPDLDDDNDQLTASNAFSGQSLAGLVVEVLDGSGAVVESRRILRNTDDSLIVESAWSSDLLANTDFRIQRTQIDVFLSREARLQLGVARSQDLLGRVIEVYDAVGTLLGFGPIADAVDNPSGSTTLTIAADFSGLPIDQFFIQNDHLVKDYAITNESLNFFVNEPDLVDVMFVHDEDSPADSTGYLTANRLWGLNMGPDVTIGDRLRAGGITYGNLEVLQIDLGTGNNDFNVLGTHTRPDDLATEEDEFFQTWTFINTGDDVEWQGVQGDRVTVAVDENTVEKVVEGSVSSASNPTQSEFALLRDVNAPFGATDQLAGYTVTLNPGTGEQQIRTILGNTVDTLFIDGLWDGVPDGDLYEITNPADGALAINTQAGDDMVDARSSTLGIVVFGGLGDDTVYGGAGADIVFGDRGRVDYIDEDTGAVITRLGTASQPILGTVTSPVTGTLDLLEDENAVFPSPNQNNDNDFGLIGLSVDVNDGFGFLQTPRLITNNTPTTLTVNPAFDDSLELPGTEATDPSKFRISTFPEDQTDGMIRRPTVIIGVDPELGGNDQIFPGDEKDIVMGGAGADLLDAGVDSDDDEILVGDHGQIVAAANQSFDAEARDYTLPVIGRLMSTAVGLGGNDKIISGDGNDFVLAGISGVGLATTDPSVERDVIDAGNGNNVVLGDSGFIAFAFSYGDDLFAGAAPGEVVVSAESDPTDNLGSDTYRHRYFTDSDVTDIDWIESSAWDVGGPDEIITGEGTDLVLGGSDSDEIQAGDGDNIVFGDSGQVVAAVANDTEFGNGALFGSASLTVGRVTSTAVAIGGNDRISTGVGNDILFGGNSGATQSVLWEQSQRVSADLIRDVISAGDGRNLVFGDAGLVVLAQAMDETGSSNTVEVYADPTQPVNQENPFTSVYTYNYQTDSDASYNLQSGGEDDIDYVSTVAPTIGSADKVTTGIDNDMVFGGTAGDEILTDAGNDLVFGDHGELRSGTAENQAGSDGIDARLLPLATYTPQFVFKAIDTANFDRDDLGMISPVGGDDWISSGVIDSLGLGQTDQDIVLGQQGRDVIYGGQDDDDLIGGHNVPSTLDSGLISPAMANDGADFLDGGLGDDVAVGDNASVLRRGDTLNPRMQVLGGSTIYGETGQEDALSLATGLNQLTPVGVYQEDRVGRLIVLLDHDADFEQQSILQETFGDDYIAGGGADDEIFGHLGNDVIEGDGGFEGEPIVPAENHGFVTGDTDVEGRVILVRNSDVYQLLSPVGAERDPVDGLLTVDASFESVSDGDDYVEGNGGDDTVFGNLGQDDIIGGSSTYFLAAGNTSLQRPDGSDWLFGGAGTDIQINHLGDIGVDSAHARDADVLIGDNANVARLVGVNGTATSSFLTFEYDDYGPLSIIPRAVELLDYTPGGAEYNPTAAGGDIGDADEIHGESGDDIAYGMVGNDVLYGDGQDDDLIGGYGHDWISGGTGDDGVLGDDGRIYTSRNGSPNGEPLYGVEPVQVDQEIRTPGGVQQAIIHIQDELKKTVNLTPFNVEQPGQGNPNPNYDAVDADDMIYGGLGNDFLHGGSGDDGISGAEALPLAAVLKYADGQPPNLLAPSFVLETGFDKPLNLGHMLGYEALQAEEFAAYDEYDPRSQIEIDGLPFAFNFDVSAGPAVPDSPDVFTDGNDRLFGDLGNDWLVGGTGRDHAYGGYGNDLHNMDDDQTTNEGLNDGPDGPEPTYNDIAYGGAGRDVLIANTTGDRLIDWTGEFNSYIVPFSPFGVGTVSRSLQPRLKQYLYDLSEADGADPTRAEDTAPGNAAVATRNGEANGELGLVVQKDPDWQDQTGAPDDPQPGNRGGVKRRREGEAIFFGSQSTTEESTEIRRDVLRAVEFDQGWSQGFFVESGALEVDGSRIQVQGIAENGDAVSVFHLEDTLPSFFEIQATARASHLTSGEHANVYLIFDYQGTTDFKFAGINAANNRVEIGYRDASGWHIAMQAGLAMTVDQDYLLHLKIDGAIATLVAKSVNTIGTSYLSYVFPANVDESGTSLGLNNGLVGLGTDRSLGSVDDFLIQVLPSVMTLQRSGDFSVDEPNELLDGGHQGLWEMAGPGVEASLRGTPADGAIAGYYLSNLKVRPSYVAQFDTTFQTETMAGFIFDFKGPADYKFVGVSVETNAIVIGHSTPQGFEIDAAKPVDLSADRQYNLRATLKGPTVNVELDSDFVIAHAYHGSVVDGLAGLVTFGGSTEFGSLTIASDDPAFLTEFPRRLFGDVNLDGAVTAGDALIVINFLNHRRQQIAAGESLGITAIANSDAVVDLDDSADVNGDGKVSALDALVVINQLDANASSQTLAAMSSTGGNQAILGSSDPDYISIRYELPYSIFDEPNTLTVNSVLTRIQSYGYSAIDHSEWQAEGEWEDISGEENALTADVVDEAILLFDLEEDA